jgi:hypothetical protein
MIKKILCGNGYTVIVQVPQESKVFYDTEHVRYEVLKTNVEMVDVIKDNYQRIDTIGVMKTIKENHI